MKIRRNIDALILERCLILAAPTNFFSATALFKRFMERLIPYAYWPWGMWAPKLRRKPAKKALPIASCAAPGVMGRLFYATLKQLKMTAGTIGAKKVGSLLIGQISQTADMELPETARRRIETLVGRLV